MIAHYPLMADRMSVDRDDKGQIYYEYMLSKDDAPTMRGQTVRLQSMDVLHIPGLGFADEMKDLFYSLKSPYRKNAVWIPVLFPQRIARSSPMIAATAILIFTKDKRIITEMKILKIPMIQYNYQMQGDSRL